MNKRADKVEVAVEELKNSNVAGNGAVVLETEAVVNGEHHDTSIEVHQDDVPAVAVALLNTENGIAVPGAELPPAIKCLGAGVIHWDDPDHVRFHLQFDSGQVLPIEMTKAAAQALCRGLLERAGLTTDMPPAIRRAVAPDEGPEARA
ncbi:MAG: hypothetical protein ABIS28_12105 [Caldimonas sp.]